MKQVMPQGWRTFGWREQQVPYFYGGYYQQYTYPSGPPAPPKIPARYWEAFTNDGINAMFPTLWQGIMAIKEGDQVD